MSNNYYFISVIGNNVNTDMIDIMISFVSVILYRTFVMYL